MGSWAASDFVDRRADRLEVRVLVGELAVLGRVAGGDQEFVAVAEVHLEVGGEAG